MKLEVIRMYESGLSTKEIGRRINSWSHAVYVVLKENDVDIRSKSEALRMVPCKGHSQGRYQRIAREIKPQVCETCGTVEGLCVHHVDKDHTNNTAENLMMLCNRCHMILHHNAGDIGPQKWATKEHKKEYMARWRAENKEHRSNYDRMYRLRNLERCREYDKRRYAEMKRQRVGGAE
jgi:hypothetical protein